MTGPDVLPDPTDEIDLVYMLGRHGWSDLYLIANKRALPIRITHVVPAFDPLPDLIDLACALLRGDDHHWVGLPDEPGMAILEVRRYADRRHIVRVTLYDCGHDWEAQPPGDTVLLAFDIKARHLADLIHHQADKLRSLLRERSFRQHREPFPQENFDELRALRAADKTSPKPVE